jgi:histone deacetylase 4/5
MLKYLLQVAHARLNKQGHRPLGRTQSAPLPLGHPMLAGSSITIVPTHYEEYLPEKQVYDQQQAHNFLKQVNVSITYQLIKT